MKKTIIYAISGFMVLSCLSCNKERYSMAVDVWDGQNYHLGYRPPVSIVWFKGARSDIPYKGFCQAKEIMEIMDRLLTPEIPSPPLKLPSGNSLCLFYYKSGEYISRVVVCNFDIDEDGVFIGPRGKSPALGKLLQEKEESGLEGHYGYRGPITEEMRAEIKVVQQQMLDQIREYEEQERKELQSRPFEIVDATIDVFGEPEFNFRSILIQRSDTPDPNHAMVLFGDLEMARLIVGREIKADIIRYPGEMLAIFEEFKNAQRVKQHAVNMYDVMFLDRNTRKGYQVRMAVNKDKKYVYGEGYRSAQLYKTFAEMGLFEKK